ncbi:hypothetical protein BDR05DRAFT_881020, partial [Suillus weaverae]
QTLPKNPRIHRFIWEHCMDCNCISQKVSAKKLFLCILEVLVEGQLCTYEGCIPNHSKVTKIQD